MTKILVTYHSGEGQTTRIAERISTVLGERGVEVDVREAANAPRPAGFDAVVVGDSIHVGRHSRSVTRWLRKHNSELADVPMALFQVSMTSARHDEEHDAKAEQYVEQLLARTGAHPDLVVNFAGALRYSEYGWMTKRVMRSIARREGNDTDTSRDHEYTDWSAVDRFANDVAVLAAARVSFS
jgi:menaquinone-dependent protoporphyrinogen oxidase